MNRALVSDVTQLHRSRLAYQAELPLTAVAENPKVSVLGYLPQYNEERQLWYVDVAIDQGERFWPFVRLAVCRYQPDSVAGCHLSAPIRCDFVQLPPERTLSVSRTDSRHVRVVVSGSVGGRASPPPTDAPMTAIETLSKMIDKNRTLVATLQRRDDTIPTDLGWQTVKAARMTLRGHCDGSAEVAWVCEIDAGEEIAMSRPGHGPNAWRVSIEEWEFIEGDYPPGLLAMVTEPWREPRLIYADEIDL